MPKNLKGGKHKHIKKGNRYQKNDTLILASEQQGCMYGIVTKKYGTIFDVLCSNGKTERASVRGKFRCKVWINVNDLVLVNGTELGKFYIVHKYTPDQARQLKSKGEITFDVKSNNDQDDIEFEDEKEDSIDELDKLYDEFGLENNMEINIIDKSKINNNVNTININNPNKNDQHNSTHNDYSDESESDEVSSQSSDSDDTKKDEIANRKKLFNQYKNKSKGVKNIVRERTRSAARDKKMRFR